MKEKEFIPQISNVEILDFPILAGSGNIGIKADVLGEKRMTTISLGAEHYWRSTPDEKKPLAAVGIAARTFRPDLLRHFNMDHRKVQSASELMYRHWDSTGRTVSGEPSEICVNDTRHFPDAEETEIEFECFDGFAVGVHDGKEYVMFYPTEYAVRMSETLHDNIEFHIGQAVRDTGVVHADIAMTYGQIMLVNEVTAQQAVNPLEAAVPLRVIEINTHFTPDMLDAILRHGGFISKAGYPLDAQGKVQKGYLAVDDTNHIVGFRRLALDDADKAAKLTTAIDLYRKWRQDLCSTRVKDIHIRSVPNEPHRFFIGCRIDGVQQLRTELSRSDARIWHEHLHDLKKYGDNPHDRAYHDMLMQSLAVQYYKDAILNDRSQTQGLKR